MIGKSMLEIPLRPARALAALRSAGTTPPSSPRPGSRASSIEVDGRLGLHPLHDDPAPRRPAGPAQGGAWRPPRSTAPPPGRRFWQITFPLMLPVSLTAIVLRIIFKLKLADIVINVTSGGPGGATDTVSSFIYREYRDRSNVGYGTLLAMVYLVIIIVFITAPAERAAQAHAEDHREMTAAVATTEAPPPRQRRAAVAAASRIGGRVVHLRRADRSGRSSACSRSTGRSRPRSRSPPNVHAGPPHPLGATSSRTGAAGARSASRPTRSSRSRRCATSS